MSEEPTCRVCGYSYVVGLQEDEERHRCFHDEEENGPASDMNDGICIVSLEDSQPSQQIAEQVFRIGKRETPYDFPLFTAGEPSTNEPIAAIQILGGRAIAGVLTRIRSCEQRGQLANFEQNSLDGLWRPPCGETIELHHRRAIEFIWVHKRHRGKGVLDGVLAKLGQQIGLPISEFSHSLPFTEAAIKFWRNRSDGNIYLAQSGFDLPEDWPYIGVGNDGIDLVLKGNT